MYTAYCIINLYIIQYTLHNVHYIMHMYNCKNVRIPSYKLLVVFLHLITASVYLE